MTNIIEVAIKEYRLLRPAPARVSKRLLCSWGLHSMVDFNLPKGHKFLIKPQYCKRCDHYTFGRTTYPPVRGCDLENKESTESFQLGPITVRLESPEIVTTRLKENLIISVNYLGNHQTRFVEIVEGESQSDLLIRSNVVVAQILHQLLVEKVSTGASNG